MKKIYEDSDKRNQGMEHEGFYVSLRVDDLAGGWYAYGSVYEMPADDQSLNDVQRFWSIENPSSWGFRNRADAMKARTRIKKEIAARIAARNFEGKYFEYA